MGPGHVLLTAATYSGLLALALWAWPRLGSAAGALGGWVTPVLAKEYVERFLSGDRPPGGFPSFQQGAYYAATGVTAVAAAVLIAASIRMIIVAFVRHPIHRLNPSPTGLLLSLGWSTMMYGWLIHELAILSHFPGFQWLTAWVEGSLCSRLFSSP
ncbi:MAG: hypothetical protein IRY98_05070 [Alicyclobacillaceae bacterium]|nr:hypothetical protein [Alicyclobacillaceae bacterium]